MEIRFKLNPKNVKDKVIIDFFGNEYSASETVKALIYKIATNDTKGLPLSFWGNMNMVNTIEHKGSNTPVNDIGYLMESKESLNTPLNDANGQELPPINTDIMKLFE